MAAPEHPPVAPHETETHAALLRRVAENILSAVQVRAETLEHLLVALLAEGHVLVEDYPGVGKTALARALARSLDCQFARVQCTSDLLPGRRDRHQRLRPAGAALLVPARAGVRQRRARGRDQPRVAEDPVRAARMHAGAAGHRGRAHARAGAPIPRRWPPRTRSNTRGPTRCPRPRSTVSWSGSPWAIRIRVTRPACWPVTRRETGSSR